MFFKVNSGEGVDISVAWRAPASSPGEQNRSYSLFSYLGSNCNLMIFEGFLDRFTLQQYTEGFL